MLFHAAPHPWQQIKAQAMVWKMLMHQGLIGMVNGSRSMARRLVAREKVRYAGKLEQWDWEAAIESLIRDRN